MPIIRQMYSEWNRLVVGRDKGGCENRVMRVILTRETIQIPEEVTLTLENKTVTVTGVYGREQRHFPCAQLDLQLQGHTLQVSCWQADKKTRAMVGTVSGHIHNLITGVTAGYQLTTVTVYNHFPMNPVIARDGHSVVIRNVMGGRRTRYVEMQGNTVYSPTTQERDVNVLKGTNLEDVTQTAASLQRESKDDMKRDPVKFVDGIYRKKLEYQTEGYEPVQRYTRNRK